MSTVEHDELIHNGPRNVFYCEKCGDPYGEFNYEGLCWSCEESIKRKDATQRMAAMEDDIQSVIDNNKQLHLKLGEAMYQFTYFDSLSKEAQQELIIQMSAITTEMHDNIEL